MTNLQGKLRVDDESNSKADEQATIKIIDLNDHCLLLIIDKLDVIDLIYLSQSNAKLREMAFSVFARKFSKKSIRIQCRTGSKDNKYILSDNSITVYDLQMTVRLFATFGKFITSVYFDYHQNVHKADGWIKMARSIFRNSTETLTEIEFIGCPEYLTKQIIKPMKNINRISFNSCNLGSKISALSKWFPNITHLNLIANRFSSGMCIETVFPLLKHLAIINDQSCLPFTLENLRKSIRLNQQLQYIEIDVAPDLEFVQFISNHQPDLETLIVPSFQKPISYYFGENINFERLTKCSLALKFNENDSDTNIRIEFKILKELQLLLQCYQVTDAMINFIIRNKSIEKLELVTTRYEFDPNDSGLLRIVESLPVLKRLTITNHLISSIETIGEIIRKSKSLMEFRIQRGDVMKLKKNYFVGWKIVEDKFGSIVHNRIIT